ncbi:hypothetical protein F5B18DRAFT_631767 [Nemania serpens]|nr:hypothetical protein F5B18DRAFT_631767 [Nemania serpens]
MDESPGHAIIYDGEGLSLQVIVDNQGWLDPKSVLGFRSSGSPRKRRPLTIQVLRTGAITEDMGTLKDVRIRLSSPAFDLGLGCFGHPSKVVDTGHGELTVGPLMKRALITR